MIRPMPRMRAYTGEHQRCATTSIGASTPVARSLAISGSLRIASPTHEGAMTSVIVQAPGDDVARLAREPGVRVEPMTLEDLFIEVTQ